MHYELSETSSTPTERSWEKFWLCSVENTWNLSQLATRKHKFRRLVFNQGNQNLIDFPDDLQKLAKNAFGVAAQAIIEQFIYAKIPPDLKKSI